MRSLMWWTLVDIQCWFLSQFSSFTVSLWTTLRLIIMSYDTCTPCESRADYDGSILFCLNLVRAYKRLLYVPLVTFLALEFYEIIFARLPDPSHVLHIRCFHGNSDLLPFNKSAPYSEQMSCYEAKCGIAFHLRHYSLFHVFTWNWLQSNHTWYIFVPTGVFHSLFLVS